MIPGLDDGAMIVFGDKLQEIRNLNFDDGIAVLAGLLELVQHHPALEPEIAAMRKICDGHSELVNHGVVLRHMLT